MPNSSLRRLPHVAVVGAGVIGMSIAWRLAQRGHLVDVFDAGTTGRGRERAGSSWASAGILAPGAHRFPTHEALHRLCERSLGLWPDFAHELETTSGMHVDFRDDGLWQVACTDAEEDALLRTHERHAELGTPHEWHAGAAVRAALPALGRSVQAARFLPEERQVNARAVVVALRDALRAARVPLHEDVIIGVDLDAAQPRLEHAHGTLSADLVVLAAGAWSQGIAGLPETARPPVFPVKGQMLEVEFAGDAPLRQPVIGAETYLVPRERNRIAVGATVEEAGFDTSITAGAVLSLLRGAEALLPTITDARLVETWSGFRPGSHDEAPMIGFRTDRLLVATGHYRNGLLLAPITAEVVGACIEHGLAPAWADACAPTRFDRAAVSA